MPVQSWLVLANRIPQAYRIPVAVLGGRCSSQQLLGSNTSGYRRCLAILIPQRDSS